MFQWLRRKKPAPEWETLGLYKMAKVSPSLPIQPDLPADAPAPPPAAPPAPEIKMSDLTMLAQGQLTVPQFVTKVVGEINAVPGLKAGAAFILALLAPTIEKALGSSTVAHAIITDIEAGLNGQSVSASLGAIGV